MKGVANPATHVNGPFLCSKKIDILHPLDFTDRIMYFRLLQSIPVIAEIDPNVSFRTDIRRSDLKLNSVMYCANRARLLLA